MSILLTDFVASLSQTNLVRPNRFLVYIEPPKSMSDFGLSSNDIKFYVQSATIPDRSFTEVEIKYFGMTYKIPGNETNTDLTITLINDNEWDIRNFFERWLNLISDRDNSKKEYTKDLFKNASVTVHQLGYTGEVLSKYKFFHVFPKSVSEIELNMETNDSHETMQVVFCYSYWLQEEDE